MTSPYLLVVEDEPTLATAIARTVASDPTEVVLASTAQQAHALHTAHRSTLEVVVADINLPDGNGLDLVSSLRTFDPSVGAVVATGRDDPRTADRAVALGVQGYLLKPFEMTELRINVANARRWRELDQMSRQQSDHLARLVEARTGELTASRWETIHRLSLAAEYRDPETGNHLERMSAYSAILARRAGMSRDRCEEIRMASPMHDLGKIAIPDHVLTFDGRFDDDQRRVMNEHTLIGHRILSGSSSPLLQLAAVIARSHHEWWDGSGYPEGLRGEDIPIEARIVAIADVFDALTTRRRYKAAFSLDETVAMMQSERGTHFDPELLDLFLAGLDELLFIRDAYVDVLDIDMTAV